MTVEPGPAASTELTAAVSSKLTFTIKFYMLRLSKVRSYITADFTCYLFIFYCFIHKFL